MMEELEGGLTDSLSRGGSGGMLAPLKNYAGTVALPGISWSDEPSSGLYWAGAGDMRLSRLGFDLVKYTAALVTVTGGITASTTLTGTTSVVAGAAGDMTITAGSILSASGAITFGNEDLSTTGTLTASTGTFTTLTGTLSTAAQPNITSLGTIASLVATTADIDGGTFDGVVGGTTPAAGTFTTLTATGVTTVANAAAATSPAALGQLTRKNFLINARGQINQRAVTTPVTKTVGLYAHDRFKAGDSGVTYSFAESAGTTTFTITEGTLVQTVEGNSLPSGTVVLSWTGESRARIDGGEYGVSPITATAIGGTNMIVEWDTTGTGSISLPQLEFGSVPTLFEYRHVVDEMALCQRYYFRLTDSLFSFVRSAASIIRTVNIFYPSKMRATPTITSTWNAGTSTATSGSTATAVSIYRNLGNTTNSAELLTFTAEAEL